MFLRRVVCRKRFYDEREATYAAMENMKRKQAARAAMHAKQMREGEKAKPNSAGEGS